MSDKNSFGAQGVSRRQFSASVAAAASAYFVGRKVTIGAQSGTPSASPAGTPGASPVALYGGPLQ